MTGFGLTLGVPFLSGHGGQSSSPFASAAYFWPDARGQGVEVYTEDGAARFVWDASYHEVDGTHYLIFSRWAESDTFNTGWYQTSSIHYATSSTINGTYTYGGELLAGSGSGWDSAAVHNVKVYNFGGTWYMYFMGSSGTADSQQIGVASASSITGPYTREASNPIIPSGTVAWSMHRTSNPAVVELANGTYLMLYKGYNTTTTRGQIGAATASSPLGPWTAYASNPVITVNTNGHIIEDPDVWLEEGVLRATFKNVNSTLYGVANDDSFWLQSSDGFTWTKPTNGYHAFRVDDWVSLASRAERACIVRNPDGSKKGIFVAFLNAAGTASSIRYAPFIPGSPSLCTAGTYIQAANPTFNWGADVNSIWTGNSTAPTVHRGLIRAGLDEIPAGATITRGWAIVHWRSTSGTNAHTLEFRPLTQAWVEGTGTGSATGDGATYNTYDGTNNWPGGAGALADSSSALGSVSIPNGESLGRIIVPLTGATLANLVNGLLMKATSEASTNARAFSSDDNAEVGQRPMLVLEWST